MMGLLQKAVETYDAHAHLAGVPREGHATLAPVSHLVTSAQLEITLDPDGAYISARNVDKTEPKIVIPVTEESAGRTSAPAAHPLCEQLGYLAMVNPDKNALYLDQLAAWARSEHSHPALQAILNYVLGGTILDDLERNGLIKLNPDGTPEDEKMLVCWTITGLDTPDGRVWKDKTLFEAFIGYYSACRAKTENVIDMITGRMGVPAMQHLKGVIPINGNAKLISSNDKSGFTYRGRFTADEQACTVSYASSQKAHNALRWIAADQGVLIGGRTFLCWNPRGVEVPGPMNPLLRDNKAKLSTPTEYKETLLKTLLGFRTKLPDNDDVLIAVFDAATSGRLAVTYWNQLSASDFLNRLYKWDALCCWQNGPFGIQSPPLYQIIDCAFGTARVSKAQTVLVAEDKVKREQLQRLLACRVDGMRMPLDIEKRLVGRVSNLQLFDDSTRRTILFTACAVIRKYRNDVQGEEWQMILNSNCGNRSYCFGRLLAAMERAELDFYEKTNEKRETNAIKLLQVFCNHPLRAIAIVDKQLRTAYLPRIERWQQERYYKLVAEIMEKLGAYPDTELNKPLKDVYVIGYYNQRNAFYTSNNKEEKQDEHA